MKKGKNVYEVEVGFKLLFMKLTHDNVAAGYERRKRLKTL